MGEEVNFCILQVAGEYPPSPGTGRQEPPHLLTGWGAQEPLGKWRNSVIPLSGWTHSVSPVTGAGLWVCKGQPMAELPKGLEGSGPIPPCPQQVTRS